MKAQLSGDAALIAHLRLEIARLTRTLYGQRSERTQRLIDQYELQLEELEASAAVDILAAEMAAARAEMPARAERRKPSRQPFPAHLPRVRVVVPGLGACPCCGGTRLSKMGEDVTETLEVVPRQWTVIQTVRERFSCRACESISQPPAPFHAVSRGWAGPSLLAMVLFEKYGQHQPLNRQAERYAREGVPLSLSTLADQVGACTAALEPLFRLIEAHVMAAGRLHGDDTTVPVLAKGKTSTGRVWVYVRDDRPFGGADPPAALFQFSPDRRGEHPQAHLAGWIGVLQADAYGGYAKLYGGERKPAPIIEAACWAHARRKFFELADIEAAARRRAGKKVAVIAPLALEAVRRMDELFAIEREGERPSRGRAAGGTQPALRPARGGPGGLDARGAGPPAARLRSGQGHGLHARPLAVLRPLPRRRARVHDEQRGGKGAAWPGPGPQGVAVRRLESRRPAGGVLQQPDRDGEAERRRPSGLVGRRARPHRVPPGPAPRRAAAVELAADPGRNAEPRRRGLTQVSRPSPSRPAITSL